MKSKVLMLFLFSLFMIIITDLFVDNRAYAHNQDYLPGRYLSTSRCNQTGLKLRIKESAQTTFLTSTVYSHGRDWNNKHCSSGCTHVKVQDVLVVPDSVPNLTSYYDVIGINMSASGILGEVVAYDASGSVVAATANWYRIIIKMNVDSSSFNSSTTAAQKTFIHEVGHALKLAHPVMGTSSIGHYNSGYPVAVMNQGLPNGSYISSTITTHDIQNLQGKWGN